VEKCAWQKFSTVGPEAKERLQRIGKSYQERAPYREAIAGMVGDQILELEPDAGETLRKIKVIIRSPNVGALTPPDFCHHRESSGRGSRSMQSADFEYSIPSLQPTPYRAIDDWLGGSSSFIEGRELPAFGPNPTPLHDQGIITPEPRLPAHHVRTETILSGSMLTKRAYH
jgi:hypothetical protein